MNKEGLVEISIPRTGGYEEYNKLYTAGEEYELHCLPYGILPPFKTGLKTSEYDFVRQDEQTLKLLFILKQ